MGQVPQQSKSNLTTDMDIASIACWRPMSRIVWQVSLMAGHWRRYRITGGGRSPSIRG